MARFMSLKPLGEVVARGSRSVVHAYGRGAVVKVPKPATPASWIRAEAAYVEAVRALQDAGIDYESAEATWVPSMRVELEVEGARKMLKLIDALEDSDDVQNVFANFDASDEVLEAASA